MQAPPGGQFHGQGHVDALGDEGLRQFPGGQFLLPRRDGLVHLTARPADAGPGFLAFRGRQRADPPVRQGQWGTITRVVDAHLFQFGRRGCGGDGGQGVGHIALHGGGVESRRLFWINVVVRACHGSPLPATAAESSKPPAGWNNRIAALEILERKTGWRARGRRPPDGQRARTPRLPGSPRAQAHRIVVHWWPGQPRCSSGVRAITTRFLRRMSNSRHGPRRRTPTAPQEPGKGLAARGRVFSEAGPRSPDGPDESGIGFPEEPRRPRVEQHQPRHRWLPRPQAGGTGKGTVQRRWAEAV